VNCETKGLFHPRSLPMILAGSTPRMQVTVTVSDEIVREAGRCGLSVVEHVESLITKGRQEVSGRPALESAMDRIRALRFPSPDSRR
jgi:hypothetical protein